MLKVISTAYPDGSLIHHADNRMNPPAVICLGEIMKESAKSWALNKVRKGGLAYSDLSAFEQAKRQLRIVSRKTG